MKVDHSSVDLLEIEAAPAPAAPSRKSTVRAGSSSLEGHKGFTVWLTGLSGAGKTTLSKALYAELRRRKMRVEMLDGDAIRKHLSHGLGFSRNDREENIRRIGYVAQLLTRNDVITLVSAISPYRALRDEAREKIEAFIEVYVNAPLAVCEERDPKGLYKKARAGEIHQFTGLDDPYEAPLNPEVECRTDLEDIEESMEKILFCLMGHVTGS